ncbi:MAG: 5-formyltetrahydrofolate cyclo-ligase [Hyphomicrobium sp.]|nr:MAG: 5-formyltetrahydrofolate cyclo-ligase [Hyphomicrobium sp.]
MIDDKRAARAAAKQVRAEAFVRHGAAAFRRLAEHGLEFLGPMHADAVLSGFAPIGDEIDPGPLMRQALGRGFRLALPCMQGKGKPLVFRAWTPGDAMAAAVWGISEPLPAAPVVEPDVLLVPLLAFDPSGYRLGYGGGFYDRSLERLRAMKPVLAVGMAFDEQRVDAVPHLDYDQPLDWVLTPSGPMKCNAPFSR